MADYSRFDATEIKKWTSDVFEKLGVPPRDAVRMRTKERVRDDSSRHSEPYRLAQAADVGRRGANPVLGSPGPRVVSRV